MYGFTLVLTTQINILRLQLVDFEYNLRKPIFVEIYSCQINFHVDLFSRMVKFS